MEILTIEQRTARQGPADWFTGSVFITPVANPPAPAHLQSAIVTFTPGARTTWHTHPVGQSLYIFCGLGWVQKEGEPVRAIYPGDVVLIAPGENHWHGAQKDHTMVHLAMQESDATGSVVTWGKIVTDAEYPD